MRVVLLIVSFLLSAEFLAKRWCRGEDGVDRRQPTVQHAENDQGIIQHLIIIIKKKKILDIQMKQQQIEK